VDDDDVFRRQDGRDGWMDGPGQWQLLDKATEAKRRRFFHSGLRTLTFSEAAAPTQVCAPRDEFRHYLPLWRVMK